MRSKDVKQSPAHSWWCWPLRESTRPLSSWLPNHLNLTSQRQQAETPGSGKACPPTVLASMRLQIPNLAKRRRDLFQGTVSLPYSTGPLARSQVAVSPVRLSPSRAEQIQVCVELVVTIQAARFYIRCA